MVITQRRKTEKIMEVFAQEKVSMAIFCTASHWNTEAVLLAAKRFAQKHDIEYLPLTVAMTFNYDYMPQAQRMTLSGRADEGMLTNLKHLDVLCGSKDSSYSNVMALPHLDHANPVRDLWALTKGTEYLASVMFDAQTWPLEENIGMTSEYARTYKDDVMIEGILEELTVEGMHKGKTVDGYIEKAVDYINRTGIDFLVADLGTEQQSGRRGQCRYLSERAQSLTAAIKRSMLVLHGTSCLSNDQMATLPYDGVLRVNMWTRIAREAGQYAAEQLEERMPQVKLGNFEAAEGRQYILDLTEKAADIMEEMLELMGYARLSGKNINI